MATLDTTPPAPRRASSWRQTGIAVGLLGAGFIIGAVSLATAAGDGFGPPWAGHFGGHHHGMKIGFVQHMVRNQLDSVGATTAQEDKVHDIIATTYTELDVDKAKKDEMRKQVLDLFRAKTIDRAAAEKLRAEKMTEIDAKSKKVVAAMLDAAGQLTPEQRTKLVERIEWRMAHPHWGWGGWRHPGDSERDGRGEHGSDSHD